MEQLRKTIQASHPNSKKFGAIADRAGSLGRPMARTLLSFVICLPGMVCSACSIGGLGTANVQTFDIDGGAARVVEAVGLHLDTRDTNPSLTFGFYSAVQFFPKNCDGALPRPVLSFSRVAGLQIKAGRREFSFTLGLREVLEISSNADGPDATRSVSFSPKAPNTWSVHGTPGARCISKEEIE